MVSSVHAVTEYIELVGYKKTSNGRKSKSPYTFRKTFPSCPRTRSVESYTIRPVKSQTSRKDKYGDMLDSAMGGGLKSVIKTMLD